MSFVAEVSCCPLCQSADCFIYSSDKRRQYWRCRQCQLIYADPAALLDAAAEISIYQQHQNDPTDLRYRAFLNKLAAPLQQRLAKTGLQGLDFGCGPGPTLSLMLAEAGLSFLGLGVQPPLPSWGLMISEGKGLMFFQPWVIAIPGTALFLLILSVNMLGDGARDVTAPENRN